MLLKGDVRKLDEYFVNKFDVVMWWHGPEHLQKDELSDALMKCYKTSNIMSVVACPWGVYKQGVVAGNPYERHLSYLYPEFFHELGWNTDTIGTKDCEGSNLLAWKVVE